MKIQILIDNLDSWIIPYAKLLCDELKEMNHKAQIVFNHSEVSEGDILCLLSCEKKYTFLDLNTCNLVVHESDLPQGKGWSPLTWQVIEGKSRIPISLFEATDKIDAGNIYYKDFIELDGSELVDELREKQGRKTIELVLRFVENYPNNQASIQNGESTFYPKRTPKDSELDINKTISEQFNILRVCDNEKYPAWFEIDGKKYKLKIEKTDERYSNR